VRRTRIKFCGITRPEDAAAAAAAGADAIGLIFYGRSARAVSVDRAREILTALPPFVTPVGLFVNATPGEVSDIARALGLHAVQLHGDESPQAVSALPGLSVIKAVKADRANLAAAVDRWRGVRLSGLLLETADGPEPGGTGIANDWAGLLAAQGAGLFKGLPPLIAAGGLTPKSVGAVVRQLRPFAVDVSSGIEQSKGVKSFDRMTAFAAAVRAADAE
jgi:phosphoribosylanthranilate isomerase